MEQTIELPSIIVPLQVTANHYFFTLTWSHRNICVIVSCRLSCRDCHKGLQTIYTERLSILTATCEAEREFMFGTTVNQGNHHTLINPKHKVSSPLHMS